MFAFFRLLFGSIDGAEEHAHTRNKVHAKNRKIGFSRNFCSAIYIYSTVSKKNSHHHVIRPLQSYEPFLEKKVNFGVLQTKVVWKFSVRLKKKVQVLRIFIVRVIQSTTGIYQCCSRASDLRMYISHPSGYRD